MPNVDAVLRVLMELKKGVQVEKHFDGHGKVIGKLDKKEEIDSTLYTGQERLLHPSLIWHPIPTPPKYGSLPPTPP